MHIDNLIDLMSFMFEVILARQTPSGVFAGDAFGEKDTRFTHCAVLALSLLGRLSELDEPYLSSSSGSNTMSETRKEKYAE
jgi:prenyltransferase beta subunit